MTERFEIFPQNVTKDGTLIIIQKEKGLKLYNISDVVELLNDLSDENEQLKKELFETRKELLWATSDEVDRALHYEDEVEELRKEIFE